MIESFGSWQIRSDILYLDNGAFGACPTAIAEKQRQIRQWIEENPHEFFERSYISSWEASREALASFLHADAADLVLLPGATHGMNVVIQSLHFEEGDEIVTTNHVYSSVRLALDQVVKRDGARLVVVDIPLEVAGPETVLQLILGSVTTRTRFAVIDHVPSRSGLVFPIKEIVRELATFDIDTLVDGAHAPGMIPLDIADINAAYYVANCHKWMCAPRGTGFLHVRRDRSHIIKPLVIARSPYVLNRSKHSNLEHSFGWMGTYCPSAVLTLPAAIHHLETVMPGGYDGLLSRNHDLAVLARRIVCRTLGIPLPCPDSMIGAMATIPLLDSPGPEREGMLPIQQILWREHGIVVPVYSWPSYPKRVIRLSVQAYNSLDQYLRLADCLRSVLYNERNSVPERLTRWPIKSLRQPDAWDNGSRCAPTEYASVCGHRTDNGTDGASGCLETPHQDIDGPTPLQLVGLAQSRLRRILRGSFLSHPVSIYPTAGEAETQFASAMASETESRHANLEISRMSYLLSQLDRRRLPQSMVPLIRHLLEAEDIIKSWLDSASSLRNQAHILTRTMTVDMAAPQTPTTFPAHGGEFVRRVAPYEPEKDEENLSLLFWRRALVDFTTRGQWSLARIASFLQIHAFLKDPVGGLRSSDVAAQAEMFVLLFSKLKPELDDARHGQTTKMTTGRWDEVAAQLALESSFLSQPLVRQASYVHFSGDQQLVYAYLDMDQLARSEFACPDIVIGMMRDMLDGVNDDSSNRGCLIAPIAVSASYTVCSSHDARHVITDGNNRAATITLMRFLSVYGVPEKGDRETRRTDELLRAYCRDHGLGPVCFVDLCAALERLWQGHADLVDRLRTETDKLAWFRDVRQLPVLVTEEASFFATITVDGNVDVLQPVHQSIFATDDLLVALPAKTQCHGRAKGFRAMPIR
jgi:selenocysteine lyase/cysteine desulfurase